jgi:hypothetical protein
MTKCLIIAIPFTLLAGRRGVTHETQCIERKAQQNNFIFFGGIALAPRLVGRVCRYFLAGALNPIHRGAKSVVEVRPVRGSELMRKRWNLCNYETANYMDRWFSVIGIAYRCVLEVLNA